jgi:methylated-DNA-protein-cysteine methyltransferase-like protein
MGAFTIDLARFGWFPDVLPSEEGGVESSDAEGEDEAVYHA